MILIIREDGGALNLDQMVQLSEHEGNLFAHDGQTRYHIIGLTFADLNRKIGGNFSPYQTIRAEWSYQ